MFTVNGGDLLGHSLLIVDFDGAAGYSTSDMVIDVIDVTGFTGASMRPISSDDFHPAA